MFSDFKSLWHTCFRYQETNYPNQILIMHLAIKTCKDMYTKLKLWYHGMAVTDSTYKLLKKVPSLHEKHPQTASWTTQMTKPLTYIIHISESRTLFSLKRPSLDMSSYNSPPDAYSITIAKWVGVKITWNKSLRKSLNENLIRHEDVKMIISGKPL